MKLDKNLEKMTVKELIDLCNEKSISSDVLSILRRIFTFNIFKEDFHIVPRYFLTVYRSNDFAVTTQITEEMYNIIERWIKQ